MSTKPETTQAKAPEVPWAVTPEKIAAAVKRIVEVGNPKKVILFGSAARGETHRDSDVDLLVVTGNEVSNPRQESVRDADGSALVRRRGEERAGRRVP